jgi:hypothetical protein
VERCRVYYKQEGGGFPQVWVVVNLVCLCCPWLVLAPKMLQLRTNHLVWVLCRPVWVSEACQLFLIPSQSSNTPLYPSKCCELGSVPRLLPFPLSCTSTHFWILQRVGSASLSTYFYDIKVSTLYQTSCKLNAVTYGFKFLLQNILNLLFVYISKIRFIFKLDFGQTTFFIYFTLLTPCHKTNSSYLLLCLN